ncbi:hypothetical protein HAX54_037499 [Datura stramonium]|uniref:DNA polymerase III gamma subunit domain-containing protein n=1 Tax=Datura stramonium TaxID=4076 RepID=A0ABS8SGZ6_DATST|nr:hypothetical protein [Datura stramonium]
MYLLPSKTWLAFLKFLEEPPPRVVFIFITTDLDNVPRAVLSRCQKYLFNKIRDGDIVLRLKISSSRDLDVESEALDLIALNADGSLRDAETMLDQLSLLGKRITTSLVNDLILQNSKRARELLDSGVDPIVLMSQLATLIMDIIAGTHPIVDAKQTDTSGGKSCSRAFQILSKIAKIHLSVTEIELDRLKHALSFFPRQKNNLGSRLIQEAVTDPKSSKTTEDDPSSTSREAISRQRTDTHYAPHKSGSPSSFAKANRRNSASKELAISSMNGEALGGQHNDIKDSKTASRCPNTNVLDDIWMRCIDKCHSNTLKQLLHTCGTLLSISEVEGGFVAHIAFRDSRVSRGSFNDSESKIVETFESASGNAGTSSSKERISEIPVQRIESIIREQRLETAWLQAMEKGTPGSISRLKPERNQVLPQDGLYHNNQLESINSRELSDQHWHDDLNEEIRSLKMIDGKAVQKDQTSKKGDTYPISPSLLHNGIYASNFSKESMGYESGSGAGGCFCWNNTRPPQRRGKVKQGTPVRPPKAGRISYGFRDGTKSRRTESRLKR